MLQATVSGRPVLRARHQPISAPALPVRPLHSSRTCTSSLQSQKLQGRVTIARAAEEDTAPAASQPAPEVSAEPAAAVDTTPEEVFYEGPGSNAELAVNLLLGATLIYAPLSIASVGRRLWISFKFTNKSLTIINTSPLFKRNLTVPYTNIKEIRSAPRAFGLWGDMVIFLRDGSRLEITGIEKYKEIKDYINRCRYTL